MSFLAGLAVGNDTASGRATAAAFVQRVFALGGETGYDFRPCDGSVRLTPFAGLRWQSLMQEQATEQALAGAPAAFASNFGAVRADSLVSSFGVEVEREILLANGRRVLPSLRAAWSHEFADTRVGGTAGAYPGDVPGEGAGQL